MDARFVGPMLVVGAALNFLRMLRWHGRATSAEPLLMVLHIGYGWLVLGIGLLGLTMSGLGVPLSAAIHTLTAGAIGTMILAVMTRTTLGHTGRTLSADRTTGLIYILVGLAAFEADWTMALLIASAGFWIARYAIFLLRYGPFLFKPRDAH